MKYEKKVTLNSRELLQADQLAKRVCAFDHTVKEIYLSNQYNYFPEMPTFIFATEKEQMVGMAMIYADEKPGEEVDLRVEVDPDFRRQGIATELVRQVMTVLAEFGYHDYNFGSEKAFLEQNPQFLTNANLAIDDFDYYMQAEQPLPIANDELASILTVREMKAEDKKSLIPLYCVAFDESADPAVNYIEESFRSKQPVTYVLTCHDEVVGYSAVDVGEDKIDYFYGLFIAQKFQGRGFGTFFIKKMMELQRAKGTKAFSLEVEPNNQAAIKAYRHAGFKIISEVTYLKRSSSKEKAPE